MNFRTIDIPQADSLALVRRVLEALAGSGDRSAKSIAERTGFSERHVRYRLEAARVLGFVDSRDGRRELTARASRLLEAPPGSDAERRQFRRAVLECPVVQAIAPRLLTSAGFELARVTDRIVRVSGLAPSTAQRRAVVLRAWRRDLSEHGKKTTP